MRKKEAKEILYSIGLPEKQQTEICIYTLLALANITEKNTWANATNNYLRIHDILEFTNLQYNVKYAENSRETFRKQAIHQFRIAAMIEDNGKATNSPLYRYRITNEFLDLLKSYNSDKWDYKLSQFHKYHETLTNIYASKKIMQQMPILIDGVEFQLSIGEHNELQKAIIEEFAPRYAHNAIVLYIGDTKNKHLYEKDNILADLGINITKHDKLPDVILYVKDKNWIYFIEAVTSVGPMSPKRIIEINDMTVACTAGKIFVTSFLNMATYKKFAAELAWETEVWIADNPEHLIHLNGDRFLGPH